MSLRSNAIFPFFFITLIVVCAVSNGQSNTTNDSVYSALLIDHLRNNFDDIHDVSMRFHHMDHGYTRQDFKS